MKIKNYYTYLLAFGGVVLLISLIYESSVISQTKLALLSIITIAYGLIEWIRESQFKTEINNLNKEWLVYWEEESAKKGLTEIQDPTWEARTRKKFKEEYRADKLLPDYHLKTWIFFIIYLALMIGAFYFP